MPTIRSQGVLHSFTACVGAEVQVPDIGRLSLPFPSGYHSRLCCTNPVRDSSCESSVVAGLYEQTEHIDLKDTELARV